MSPRVLLVDDDAELVELIRDYLEKEHFTVAVAHDGAAGCAAVLAGGVDIVVLDVMMPGMDGIQTLARIRAASSVPVVMLTARGDDADRIAGLELGADDYAPKPCSARELVARIRAILKRAATTAAPATEASQPIVAGMLTVWPAQRRAELDGKSLDLTSTEYNLMEILARNAGRPVSKAELSEKALGRAFARFDRSIDVHMSKIRQKLGNLTNGHALIQTVVRKGYQLILK